MDNIKLNDTALFIGAGFSKELGLKTTREIEKEFTTINYLDSRPSNKVVQNAISRKLKEYWNKVFGWQEGSSDNPSFEDHFTTLDLSANLGHSLGKYSAQHLRAIRRLSIHRIFNIINKNIKESSAAQAIIKTLCSGTNNLLISTNWDIGVEKLLGEMDLNYHYGIETFPPPVEINSAEDIEPDSNRGILLCKLHGSSNWNYCDSCRRVYAGEFHQGKTTLSNLTFLKSQDYEVLDYTDSEINEFEDVDRIRKDNNEVRNCSFCNIELSARIGTFSYTKSLNFFQFQAVWDAALAGMRKAKIWIFVGYSLPEADYEIRHLLKTAQLSDENFSVKEIWAIVGDDEKGETKMRYKKFFGDKVESRVFQLRLGKWFEKKLYKKLIQSNNEIVK